MKRYRLRAIEAGDNIMGALPKNTVHYFPHFTRIGVTRRVLEAKYGNEGYAFWFKLLETLCTSDGHVFDFAHNLSRVDFLIFVHMDEAKAVEILNLLAELEVIDRQLWETKRVIWSQRLVDYLAPLYKKRTIKEKPARPHSGTGMTPGIPKSGHSDTGNPQADGFPTPEMAFPTADIHRVEESRVEESRERECAAHTPPLSFDQVADFCKARKSPVDPQRFFAYYAARGWQAAGRPIMDWQAQVLYWETLEKTKVPVEQARLTPMAEMQESFNRGAIAAEDFHWQALKDGKCCYCGQPTGYFKRNDGTDTAIQKPCTCAQYQAEFEKAVHPAPAQPAAAAK